MRVSKFRVQAPQLPAILRAYSRNLLELLMNFCFLEAEKSTTYDVCMLKRC